MYTNRQPKLTIQQVRHLPPHHFNKPKGMFYAFCDQFPITETRNKLWGITKAFFSSEDANHLTGEERGDYLRFYEHLEASLEAIYLLNERHVQKEYKEIQGAQTNIAS